MCKGSQTTTSQSSQSPDPQAYALYSNLLQRAQGVANQPYTPYGGELVAPVNPQQNLGIANINNYAGAATPYIQTAGGLMLNNSLPLTPQQIQQYQSPYIQDVVNATQAQFGNQNQQQLEALRGRAISQGALGGNRQGIAEAELANQQQLAQAPVVAGLMNQGYQSAIQTALAQKQLGQAGAYGLGNLGVALENSGLTGANAQVGAGTLQQQTQQAQDAAKYQQYLQQLGYPFQTTQWLAGIGTGVGSQMGGTSTGQTTGPAPSPFSQILGGITGIGGMLGQMGLFSALSDRRVKENVKAVGKLKDGQTLYRFNYKGDPTTHVGLIAQEVEKRHPEAVGSVNGIKTVDYDVATRDAAGVANRDEGGRVFASPDDQAFLNTVGNDAPLSLADANHIYDAYQRVGGGTDVSDTQFVKNSQYGIFPWTNLLRQLGLSYKAGGGVANRAFGGGMEAVPSANYPVFGGGYGQPVMPYSGGKGWVPGIGLAHGNPFPSLANAPKLPQQQQNGNIAKQMSDVGGLAKQIYNGFNTNSFGDPIVSQSDDSLGGAGMSASEDNPSMFWRGGVAGYADGGDVDPASFDDRFNAVTPAPSYPTTFVDRYGVVPTNTDVSPAAVYRAGLAVPFDSPAATPEAATPSGDVPLPRARPEPTLGDSAAAAPATDASAPLPRERPITGEEAIPNRDITAETPTLGYQDNISRYGDSISGIESGGRYDLVGPATRMRNGTVARPYGKYQVMDFNIPTWTEEVLGHTLTPEQFRRDPNAQEAVFRAKFGQYVNKYGPEGAARAWFGGEGGMNNPNARDVLGTTVADYGRKFMAGLGGDAGRSNTGERTLADAGAPTDTSTTDLSAQTKQPSKGLFSGVDLSANSKLWPTLMSAGFGMMASRSPFAGVAIGEGAQAGLQTYENLKQREQQVGFTQQQLDLKAKQLSQEADHWEKDYRAKMAPYNGAMTAYEKGRLQQEATKLALQRRTAQVIGTYTDEFMQPQKVYGVPLPGGRFADPGTGRIISGIDPNRGPILEGAAAPSLSAPAQQPVPNTNTAPERPPAPNTSTVPQQSNTPSAPTSAGDVELPPGMTLKDYENQQNTVKEQQLNMLVPVAERPQFDRLLQDVQTQGTAPVLQPGNATADLFLHPLGDRERELNPTALSTLPVGMQGLVKMMVEGKLPPPSSFALRSPFWQRLLMAARQYDPQFDMITWGSRAQAIKDMTSGVTARQLIRPMNTLANHMLELEKAQTALDNWKSGSFGPATGAVNDLRQRWLTGEQDPRLSTLRTAATGVSAEAAKAFRGAGATTLEEIRKWESAMFDPSLARDAQRAANAELVKLVMGQLDSVSDQWDRAFGTSRPKISFLSPKAQASYQHFLGETAASTPESKASIAPQRVQQNGWIYERQPDGSMKAVGRTQ